MLNNIKPIILEAAKKEGIDLIGFAPKSRFDKINAAHNPFSIFPEGKTVIILGKRICRGSLRGVEEGTNFYDYMLFGNNWLEDEFLSLACYNLVNVLEDNGWEGVPLFDNPPEIVPTGIPVAPDRPAPNVFPDFVYASVACGLCEISFSGIPLTEKFGSRQRFQMIITDAEIEPTPILEKHICTNCKRCADACPLNAISKTETEEIEICGKKMIVAKIDYDKCRKCKNGAISNRLCEACKPDRIAALCNRTCMCHLEQNGVLENNFENVFRKRESWALDCDGSFAKHNTEVSNNHGGEFSKSENWGNHQ